MATQPRSLGLSTKSALNDSLRLGSTIRESMRYDDLELLSVGRMVVNPRGVSIQVDDDKSSHVPPGASSLCLPSHGVHHDPFYYQSPLEFQPFRYSEPREEFLKQQQQKEARSSNGEDLTRHKTALDLKTASLVTTSEAFLAFGHGRHACPGRFFAAQEMKLMLAYVLQITI